MADAIDLRAAVDSEKTFNGPVAKFRLKRDMKIFYIHRDLLAKSSTYLYKLHKSEGSAATLDNVRSKLFRKYVQFLYTDKIHCLGEAPDPEDEDAIEEHKHEQYDLLVDLYLLGIKLEDPDFQNATINALIAVYNELNDDGDFLFPQATTINKAYNETDKESSLRRLFVDITKWNEVDGAEMTTSYLEEFNHDYIKDLALSSLAAYRRSRLGRQEVPSDVKCCDYHVHKTDSECTLTKSKNSTTGVDAEADAGAETETEASVDGEGARKRRRTE